MCIGTWNLTHWSAAKATIIATEVGASILAVQETHLAPLPLEWAHTTAHALGLRLHMAVQPSPSLIHPMGAPVASGLSLPRALLSALSCPQAPPGVCYTPCAAFMQFSFLPGLAFPVGFSYYQSMPPCRSVIAPWSGPALLQPCWT